MKKRFTCLLSGLIFAIGVYGQQHNTHSVTATPVAAFNASTLTVCACQTVTFTDASTNGPTTWRWSFPGGMPDTSTLQNPPAVTYCIPGKFPVALYVSNGSGSDSVYVTNYITVNPLPTVTVMPSKGGICTAGIDSVCFTISGMNPNYSYAWNPAGTSNEPCFSPLVSTNYTLVVTNTVTGCTFTTTDSVIVGNIEAKINGDTTMCAGSFDTLNAAGGSTDGSTTYIWSTGATTTQIIVSPTTTTTYTLIMTQSPGSCTSTASITVVPSPKPVFTFTGSDSVCKGQCTGFTATGPYTYVWFDNFSFDTVYNNQEYVLCPPASENIHLFVINKGCVIDSTIHIKVTTLGNVYFTGASNLCQGSTTLLTAHGGTQYKWSTNQTTSSITVMPPSSITYTCEISNGACYKDTTFSIRVDTMPTIKFFGDTSVCIGDSSLLYLKNYNGNYTFLWSNGKSTDSIAQAYIKRTTYTLTVTNGSCSKDTTVVVKVYPHPKGKVVHDTTICQFDTVRLVATGGNYYIWGPRNTGLDHYRYIPANDTDTNGASPIISTKYMVQVCTWGCCDTVYDSIGIIEGAAAMICCDTCVSSGTPVTLTANFGNGQTSVSNWVGNDLASTTGSSVVASPFITSKYYVHLENHATGCRHTDSVTISICNCNVFVPNIFSPNGDGYNDVLYVRSDCIKKLDFAIYDRWGNKVFETTSLNDGWDGTYKGKKMDMGTFVWFLNAIKEDGTLVNIHGNTALIR